MSTQCQVTSKQAGGHWASSSVTSPSGYSSASLPARCSGLACPLRQRPWALEVAHVNIPVGLLIWVMIIPMLMKIDFSALREVYAQRASMGITLFVNWAIKPFTMALLGWLFIKQVFAPWLPAAELDSYMAGLILLGAAPAPQWSSYGATSVTATPTSP